MAEINVERKQPSVWPWIVGLVVLALLVWVLVEQFGGEGGADAAGAMDADTATVTAPVAPGPGMNPPPRAGLGNADTSGILPDTAL